MLSYIFSVITIKNNLQSSCSLSILDTKYQMVYIINYVGELRPLSTLTLWACDVIKPVEFKN